MFVSISARTQGGERFVDVAGFLEALASGVGIALALRACQVNEVEASLAD